MTSPSQPGGAVAARSMTRSSALSSPSPLARRPGWPKVSTAHFVTTPPLLTAPPTTHASAVRA